MKSNKDHQISHVKCQHCKMEMLSIFLDEHIQYACEKINNQSVEICNFCGQDVPTSEYIQHFEKCQKDYQQYTDEEFKIDDVKKKCPACNSLIRYSEIQNHFEECLPKNLQKCDYCGQQFVNFQFELHKQLCEQVQGSEYLSESMLNNPDVAFLQCIYCHKDILEDQYQNHIQLCGQIEKCPICQQEFPHYLIKEHTILCSQNLDYISHRRIICQLCNQEVRLRQYESHILQHLQELTYDEQIQMDPKLKEKMDKLTFDPKNQLINKMSEDELFKYFADVDLNEFQKKSGISKSIVNKNIKSIVYDKNNQINEEDIKCLVCQESFEKGDQLRQLPCKHQFHIQCIDEWLSRNAVCPVCRRELKSELIINEQQNEEKKEVSNQNIQTTKPPQNIQTMKPPQNIQTTKPPQNIQTKKIQYEKPPPQITKQSQMQQNDPPDNPKKTNNFKLIQPQSTQQEIQNNNTQNIKFNNDKKDKSVTQKKISKK